LRRADPRAAHREAAGRARTGAGRRSRASVGRAGDQPRHRADHPRRRRAEGAKTLPGHALPLDGGAAPARESTFAEEDLEGNVLQAVRTRAWKLITANQGNPRGLAPEELYDLPHDPGERRNVVASAPADAADRMRAALGRSVLEAREHEGASEQAGVDA